MLCKDMLNVYYINIFDIVREISKGNDFGLPLRKLLQTSKWGVSNFNGVVKETND